MVKRNTYDEMIQQMKNVYSHHTGFDFENAFSQIMHIRDNFVVKVMVIGHFNAGKSALLNALMKKPNFLREAQKPQTAMATELIFDEDEAAYAYDLDGNKEAFNPNKEYTSNEYDHLEYRLNVLALKEIEDFTLVDTPGFDAGIEAHTKALANYIGIGSAYLVVVDQEKGGIDQITLSFIQEISNYSRQIAVLINKCDKITEKATESIADAARFTLLSYGLPYKVYTVSKRDADISEKLISIVSSFDAQAAFNKTLKSQIKAELINAEKILSVTQRKIFLDTFDLESDIAAYTRLEEQLSYAFKQKRDEANEALENTVQEVSERIRSALEAHSDSVAEALLSGNQTAAEAIIVETIRPIMLATMEDISIRQIDDITESLDFTGLVNKSEGIDLTDVAVNLADNLKGLIVQGSFGVKSITDIEGSDKKKNIYRAMTGIAAIATDIIAPWLEVVIILLPDIVSLLNAMFGESSSELAKRRFVNNVVPQIINRIYPQVKQNVERTTKLVLDEYKKLLSEKIEIVKKSITEAENKKRQKTEDFESYKKMLSDDRNTIAQAIKELG